MNILKSIPNECIFIINDFLYGDPRLIYSDVLKQLINIIKQAKNILMIQRNKTRLSCLRYCPNLDWHEYMSIHVYKCFNLSTRDIIKKKNIYFLKLSGIFINITI